MLEGLEHRHLKRRRRNVQLLDILLISVGTGPLAVYGLGETVALPREDDNVEKEISVGEAAAECGMARSTFHDKALLYESMASACR